jgi:hypothetical protein
MEWTQMTTNNRLKQRARAYAAEHGLAYADARRILTSTGSDTDPSRMRVLTIQQVERPDHVLPYPFHIDEDGFVGRQSFWRGNPIRLVGFVESPDSFEIALEADDWFADPDMALGMHPVMVDRAGTYSTYPGEVESCSVSHADRVDPTTVMATVSTSDQTYSVRVGVGHLLGHLHAADEARIKAAGWSDTDVLFGWLLRAAGEQEAPDWEPLLAHLDAAADGGDPLTVTVSLDPVQAAQRFASEKTLASP